MKDAVHLGKIDLKRVATKQNAADGFIKALEKLQFDDFVRMQHAGPKGLQ